MDHLSTDALLAINDTANLSHTTIADRPVEPSTLARCVHRAILRLAPGRIRDLRVDEREGALVLYGKCGTYYSKQIAQHAAMDLARGERRVKNQIVVDE